MFSAFHKEIKLSGQYGPSNHPLWMVGGVTQDGDLYGIQIFTCLSLSARVNTHYFSRFAQPKPN